MINGIHISNIALELLELTTVGYPRLFSIKETLLGYNVYVYVIAWFAKNINYVNSHEQFSVECVQGLSSSQNIYVNL